MKNGFGRTVGLILLWGFVWAIPGMAIELLMNLGVSLPFAAGVDMWPQTLGIPGLIAGVLFCALLAVSGRLGGVGTAPVGLLLGLGAAVGAAMAGIVATGVVGGEETTGTYVFVVLMSVITAVVSAAAFRFLEGRRVSARAEA